ncbi:MAG: hypothetical protein BWX88_02769 [Planctomycetes bacterium ADurb.Bin126]|nr:MAG: hypothetical protein BWX88_02769 [Planctomycetes bacterium ADurb.Bin126]HOD79946.1 hypothetical protein [Phycisphaerae bacterium]HQL73239.1 hypothetical protein [Phycisphaerae bacterium]
MGLGPLNLDGLTDGEKIAWHVAYSRESERTGCDLQNGEHVHRCAAHAWQRVYELAGAHQRARIAALIDLRVHGRKVEVPEDLDASGVGVDPVQDAKCQAAQRQADRLARRREAERNIEAMQQASMDQQDARRRAAIDKRQSFRTLFAGGPA